MMLERYRAKRDFGRTPEPAPETVRPAGPGRGATPGGVGRFVIHRHRARRLHYDLRLEIDGVLASWALPKGPTRDPDERRFAARTEDHPLEYLDFEGVIPRGQYGAGDSICWDWGTFEPELTHDPGTSLRAGELKLRLRGEKLAGRFTLVRTGGRERPGRSERAGRVPGGGGESAVDAPTEAGGEGEAWLLIAKAGPDAIAGWDPEDHPASVKTGRTNEEVAAGEPPRFEAAAPAPLPTLDAEGSVVAAQPAFVEPMLATPGRAPFDDPDWLFEPKWDGYRVQAVAKGGAVHLWTRNRADAGAYFPELLGPPTWLAATDAIVDGEVVALDERGRPDFGLLQGRLGGAFGGEGASSAARTAGKAAPLVYTVFDLLACDGRLLLGVALEERKALLRLVLRDHPRVRYGAHVEQDGIAFFAAAAAQGLEGTMAKHRRSRYEPGRRSTAWLKLKIRPEQELVVAGYVPGRGTHRDLGALVVGVMEGGRLRHAGRVGSGLDTPTRAALKAALDRMARPTPPFDDPAGLGDLSRDIPGPMWAEPVLVIRAEIGGWSRDGMVRQAAFVGLAPAADPRAVERRDAVGPEAAERELARAEARAGATGRGRIRAIAQPAPPASAIRVLPPRASTGGPAADAPALRQAATDDELAALDALPADGKWQVGGHELSLTNLDKDLAPGRPGTGERAITKRDLVRYLVEIAPVLLPHLAGRALNLARYPNGVDRPSFWQKEIPAHVPAWLARWREPDPPDRAAHAYLLADRVATLAWLGNQAAVELHPWTSSIEAPDRPRYALVDIDPGERTTWEETLVLARLFHRAFEHLGVTGFPKVTGKRGIQVFVPIAPRYSFVETRAWVEGVSRAVGSAVPELVSWEWSKDRRDGRARLDYTQNWRNRTLVAPYSARPAAGLPVSAPITWDELDDEDLRPDRWTIRTIPARIRERGDLFAGALASGQDLPPL